MMLCATRFAGDFMSHFRSQMVAAELMNDSTLSNSRHRWILWYVLPAEHRVHNIDSMLDSVAELKMEL